jgi:hypothetical protein
MDEIETQRIKDKMAELVMRWKNKFPAPRGSTEFMNRSLDRMTYRELDRKLKKYGNSQQKLMPTDDLVTSAKKVFQVD